LGGLLCKTEQQQQGTVRDIIYPMAVSLLFPLSSLPVVHSLLFPSRFARASRFICTPLGHRALISSLTSTHQQGNLRYVPVATTTRGLPYIGRNVGLFQPLLLMMCVKQQQRVTVSSQQRGIVRLEQGLQW